MISALCISQLRRPGGFRAEGSRKKQETTGLAQYREGLRYMRATPLVAGVALISLGWASGGGAAQMLFSLFGEQVFHRGAAGIGMIWGCAGIGLLIGASIAYRLGKRLSFVGYKRTIPIVYLIHGGAYVAFSQMPTIAVGVRVHCDFASGGGDQFRAELFAAAASRGGSVSRTRVRYAGIADVVDDDGFDDGRGDGVDQLQSASDWRGGGVHQFHHGVFLVVERLARKIAGAAGAECGGRRGTGSEGGASTGFLR